VPPFNTAIVNGYNALAGARVRLGKWDDFLAMRAGCVFRRKAAGDSDAFQPVIPREASH